MYICARERCGAPVCLQQVNLRKGEEGGKGERKVGDDIIAGGDDVEEETFFIWNNVLRIFFFMAKIHI